MSFRCNICRRACPSGYRPNIIFGTAPCEHPERPAVHNEKGETVKRADPGGTGTRIVSQHMRCNSCAGKPEPRDPDKIMSKMLPAPGSQ